MKTKFSLRLLVVGFIALASGVQCALAAPPKAQSGASSNSLGSTNILNLPKPEFTHCTYQAQPVYMQNLGVAPGKLGKTKRELKKIDAELSKSGNGNTFDVVGPKQLYFYDEE